MNAEQSFQQPPREQHYLRASDADRQAALDIIDRGFEEGRLTPDEHTERSERALRARTQPELNVLTSDLLPVQDSHHADDLEVRPAWEAAPRRYASTSLSAVLSTKERDGTWLVPPTVDVSTFMGGAKIDFREATFESKETTIHLNSVMGEIKIWLPAGVEVVDDSRMVMSETKLKKLSPPIPGRPRIVLTGLQIMSSLIIYGSDYVTLGDRIMGKF